jgi:membrane protease YdiL (CAAX protease family)
MNQEPDKTVQPDEPPSTFHKIFFNEREMRAGWRVSIYVALGFLFLLALQFAATWLHLPLPTRNLKELAPAQAFTSELLEIIAAFGAALLLGKFERRTIGTYGLPAREAFRGRFWQGVLWGLGMITVMILLISAAGGFSFGQIALSHAAILKYAVLWAIVFLMVGFFEEFLFRGYTQFTLASGMGFWPAAILLSAGFGAAHLGNKGEGPVGALSVFVIAMFFCLTLRRTGNLWFAVGLHAAFDWGETFLYSVPNSGMIATGHLSNSALHGPRWLTGGTVGPEGSVMAFAVIGAAFVLFAILYRRPPELAAATASSDPAPTQSASS